MFFVLTTSGRKSWRVEQEGETQSGSKKSFNGRDAWRGPPSQDCAAERIRDTRRPFRNVGVKMRSDPVSVQRCSRVTVSSHPEDKLPVSRRLVSRLSPVVAWLRGRRSRPGLSCVWARSSGTACVRDTGKRSCCRFNEEFLSAANQTSLRRTHASRVPGGSFLASQIRSTDKDQLFSHVVL